MKLHHQNQLLQMTSIRNPTNTDLRTNKASLLESIGNHEADLQEYDAEINYTEQNVTTLGDSVNEHFEY